jgi:hypothetical protein
VSTPPSFGAVVRDLLIQSGIVVKIGNPDWAAFAEKLPTTSYESLRKAVTGDRWPGQKIMEEVAAALKIEPSEFYEYRLIEARKQFDPAEVGPEQALANLVAWNDVQPKRAAKRRPARRPRSA